jgi:hypothetical protein
MLLPSSFFAAWLLLFPLLVLGVVSSLIEAALRLASAELSASAHGHRGFG